MLKAAKHSINPVPFTDLTDANTMIVLVDAHGLCNRFVG